MRPTTKPTQFKASLALPDTLESSIFVVRRENTTMNILAKPVQYTKKSIYRKMGSSVNELLREAAHPPRDTCTELADMEGKLFYESRWP
jgi:hypothetical protein